MAGKIVLYNNSSGDENIFFDIQGKSHFFVLGFDTEKERNAAYWYFGDFGEVHWDETDDYEDGSGYLLNLAIKDENFNNQVENYFRHQKLEKIQKNLKL